MTIRAASARGENTGSFSGGWITYGWAKHGSAGMK